MPNANSETFREEAAVQEFLERPRAVAHVVFHLRIDFAEGLVPAFGNKDRIVAEAQRAARGEGELAMHFTFEAFHLASQARISNLKMQSIRPKPLFLPSARPNLPKTLAIMTVAPTKAAFDIIRALLDEVSSRGLEYDIVVAGTTLDDTEIMSYPSTFVTGALENEEDLANVLLPYNLSAIFLGFDAPIFGHPKIEAARSSHLPVAYVDWSKANRRKRDLAIPASTDVKMIAKLVADWLASGCVPS